MIRIFIFIFLHVSVIFAASNSEILKRADILAKSYSKTEVFRAYNDYKNVYLRSVIKSNLNERKHALEGIVTSGNRLDIDVSKYQKELNKLSKKKITSTKKKTSKNIKSKIKLIKHNVVKKAQWKNGELEFVFTKKLKKSDVNYFRLTNVKKKSYRYIFDVHAAKYTKFNLKHKELKRISIAQKKNNMIRIVLESSKKLNLRFKLIDNKLIINPHLSKITSPSKHISKTLKKKKRKAPKNSSIIPKGKVVVIDPGHGGKDTGAIGYKNYREKSIVLAVSKKVAAYLKSKGIRVHLTRTNDKFIKLRKRTNFANKKKADIFISIHANSVPKRNALKAKGLETYFLSRSRSSRATRIAATENSKEIEDMNYFGKKNFLSFMNREKIIASNKLAIDIQRGMLSSLHKKYKDVKDNGVREGPFWVLVGAQMPAVLLEIGFISHPTEASHMVNKKYQDYLAKGIAEGIVRYFINNP